MPYAVGELNKGSVTDNGAHWQNMFSTEFLFFEKWFSPGRATRCQEQDHDSVNATPYPDVENSRSPEALTPITVDLGKFRNRHAKGRVRYGDERRFLGTMA